MYNIVHNCNIVSMSLEVATIVGGGLVLYEASTSEFPRAVKSTGTAHDVSVTFEGIQPIQKAQKYSCPHSQSAPMYTNLYV